MIEYDSIYELNDFQDSDNFNDKSRTLVFDKIKLKPFVDIQTIMSTLYI